MKKKLILLFISILLNSFIHCQLNYEPFAKSDKFWFYGTNDGSDSNPGSIGTFVVWTKGDTIINNQSYVKLYKSDLKGSHPCQFPPCFVPDFPYLMSPGGLLGFLRDDILTRKVYYKKINPEWDDCIEEEIELYDFSETVDSIPICLKSKIANFWGDQEFGSFDSLTISNAYNKERRVFNFQAPYLFNGLAFITNMQIIEGIGSTFYSPFTQFENTHFAGFCEGSFEECKLTSTKELISEFKVYPNPTNNTFTINTDIIYDNVSVIDLNGKILLNANSSSNEIDVSELNNGIYILELRNKNQVSGKTKIVKVK